MQIIQASPDTDQVIFDHYMALWDSYGTSPDLYDPEARRSFFSFLREGRERYRLQTFTATEEGQVIGSAGCQLAVDTYPRVIKQTERCFGYIWHVLVRPEFQRRGIGRDLTQAAVDYLRDLGCTTIVLNASEAGAPLYRSMGFASGTEMRLKSPR